MKHESDPDPDLLGGLRVPRAPTGLRERVLDTATAARTTSASAWQRELATRPARLAWAASVMLLALLHVGESLREASMTREARLASESTSWDPELVEVLTPPKPVGVLSSVADDEEAP